MLPVTASPLRFIFPFLISYWSEVLVKKCISLYEVNTGIRRNYVRASASVGNGSRTDWQYGFLVRLFIIYTVDDSRFAAFFPLFLNNFQSKVENLKNFYFSISNSCIKKANKQQSIGSGLERDSWSRIRSGVIVVAFSQKVTLKLSLSMSFFPDIMNSC